MNITRLCDHMVWHLTSIITVWTIIVTMDMLYKDILLLYHRLIHTMRTHNMASDQHYYSIWWRHQVETFFALLALCEGNPTVSPVHSPHKGPGPWSLMFSLMCAEQAVEQTTGTGDLGRHRVHYDVTVMMDHYWNIGYTNTNFKFKFKYQRITYNTRSQLWDHIFWYLTNIMARGTTSSVSHILYKRPFNQLEVQTVHITIMRL